MIVEHAPAKLNLALHVRGRRDDGYHDIETLFAFCADGDELRIEDAASPALHLSGPFAADLIDAPGNLVLDAAAAFDDMLGATSARSFELVKRLPVASGIGGGSADAAATLRALARRAEMAIDDPRLFVIAAALGSDVPACLAGRTAIGGGRGERLHPVDGLAGMPVLLVNPGVAVPTRDVFGRWDGDDRGPLPAGDAREIALAGRNDLQVPAKLVAPVIGEVLDALDASGGAWLVRMSGSGATCFALFEVAADRDRAGAAIRRAYPGWWCLETVLT